MAEHDARAQKEPGADVTLLQNDPMMVSLTIKQICRAGPYSRAHAQELISSSKLPSFLVGRCRRVLLADYLAYVERLKAEQAQDSLGESSGLTPPLDDYFRIAAADMHRDGLPDLADPTAQQFYTDIVADADLVVVDNLSTLCRALKENEADSWAPVQAWCLGLRRQGKSVLLVHHDRKNGGQRGTSKKEDVLDSVIGLRRPPDYKSEEGARFEIHFEKSRGFYGPDAEPFEVRLTEDRWQDSPIRAGSDDASLRALHDSGMSIRDIAERTGVPRSSVQRRIKEAG